MLKQSSKTIDRSKKWVVIDNNKVISKHVDFYLAQCGVERHLRNNKISNDYKIIWIGKETAA